MSNTPAGQPPRKYEEEPPPFGGSWRALYGAVLAWLAVLVVLFYLFTRAFR
ncbi:MAG TPA: hypothetical protein VN228_08735 [Pyrinomonadaceae bacterium]|nr:hypothetical protein [Pyrinomonadaceae bacterium]